MANRIFGRRALLGLAGIGGAAAWIGLPRPGAAFRFVEDDVAATDTYLAACRSRLSHDEVVRELIAQLTGEVGPERAREVIAAAACPLCGCSLAGPAHAGAEPPAE